MHACVRESVRERERARESFYFFLMLACVNETDGLIAPRRTCVDLARHRSRHWPVHGAVLNHPASTQIQRSRKLVVRRNTQRNEQECIEHRVR